MKHSACRLTRTLTPALELGMPGRHPYLKRKPNVTFQPPNYHGATAHAMHFGIGNRIVIKGCQERHRRP